MEHRKTNTSEQPNPTPRHQSDNNNRAGNNQSISKTDEIICLYQSDKKAYMEIDKIDSSFHSNSRYNNQKLGNESSESLVDYKSSSGYCKHQQDRRTKLCKDILQEPCPSCQPAVNTLSDSNIIKKPVIKSRYMDFYYKQQNERQNSETLKNTFIPQLNKYYETEHTTPMCLVNNLEPKPCKTMARTPAKPISAKSRYMDYLDNIDHQPNEELKKVSNTSRMDWNDYHRLHTIHKFLNDLEFNFPSLCTTGVIGLSLEGRDLKVLKVSNSNFKNSSVWIDSGIHAREWIAPAVNTYIANYIVKNFNVLPKCMTNKDWYFLPVMNPDGYEHSHTKCRLWRKNRAMHDRDCTGVDLNRNFSYGWGGKGSSEDPNSQFYRGPHPFSEPESRAVRDMLKSGINFKVYITLHSFGEVILFPFAYRDELCPDYIRLLEGATAMAKAIHKTSGNTYKVGISRDVMYGAAGTSCDWSYGEAKIPFCYLLELRSKKHRFRLPQVEIEETAQEILSAVMALMDFVDKCDLGITR